jgi:nitroreductase
MNEAIRNIKARRSIRKYTDAAITNEQIQTILECAMVAPTARNQQAFRFIVIDDKNILNEIAQNIEHAKMCAGANKAILVCSEVKNEMQELYWIQDASAATQNILLSATALGIGSVWVALHPRVNKVAFVTKQFRLPPQIKPLCLVALGIPDEKKEPNERFDAQKVRYNTW